MNRTADRVEADGAVASEVAAAVTAGDLPIQAVPRRRRPWVVAASYVVTVFVLVTFNFALPRLMPGDPIDALLVFGSPNWVQNDQTRGELAEYYRLDKPVVEQYGHYLAGLVRGDFGTSIVTNAPVADELKRRVGWSLLLIATATVISMLIGLPAGVHSGWKRGKNLDRGLLGLFLAWQNLPIFILGSLALVTLSFKAGLFPLSGATTPFGEYTGFAHVIDVARHLALPALLMGLDFATLQYMVMRSSIVSELGSDYLLAGRVKGLKERRLKYRYAGRNALLPVVTVIGLQFSLAITSVVFIEGIFGYPGVGGYMLEAIGTRDYPAMQGSFLLLTIMVVSVNALLEIVYRRLDPRTTT